ncbi:hypothetical protein M8J76_006293 [Diaphorina citri]|nr:hypothetical protein M8J76_006293 [Diaphorina citri]
MNASNIFNIDCNEITKTKHEPISDILGLDNITQIHYTPSEDFRVRLNDKHKQLSEAAPPDKEIYTSDATLQWLPTEMVEAILKYLTPMDIMSCAAVCQKWHEMSDNATIWRQHCRKNQWKLFSHLCEPCLLNSDLDMSQFSLWKQCFLTYSRIRNNWMEGNSWQRIVRLDSNYTNVVANSSIIITWFFIQNIKIYKVVNHTVIEWQSFQPVLKRRPIESIIINEKRNAFIVIQYGLLQFYEETIVNSPSKRNNTNRDNELEGRGDEMKTEFVLKFCKSFDVDEHNIELCNRKINNGFQEWYERNVIRCNVNLNKTFKLMEQIKVNNSVHDFHVNNDYLVLDMMDNIRFLQIWETHSFTVLNKKCKIIGDNENLGNILLVDNEVMFHRDNSVIIYDIKRKQCSTYPTYKIGTITNIILAPYNLFILEYHMSDGKFVYCLYDRVTYRWIVKKFIMSFKRKPQIFFLNLNSIIIKEFNLVHYFTFW